jgi:hypothetical protein
VVRPSWVRSMPANPRSIAGLRSRQAGPQISIASLSRTLLYSEIQLDSVRHVGGLRNGVLAGQREFQLLIGMRPQQDSNLRTRLRRPLLYPLSYGGWRCVAPPSRCGPEQEYQ